MKRKLLFFAVVIAVIGLNSSMFLTNDANGSSLSNFIKLSVANTEGGFENCYEHWQPCTLRDNVTGCDLDTCKDPCDENSGTSCSGAIACAAGLEGECIH